MGCSTATSHASSHPQLTPHMEERKARLSNHSTGAEQQTRWGPHNTLTTAKAVHTGRNHVLF